MNLPLSRSPKDWVRSPFSRKQIIIIVITIGLSLRLFIAFRDLNIVDRLFVPDDTYYTLSIARSMANGLGPSVDGIQLTNGFQPLLAFLMVPVFSITDNPNISLRVVLLFSALCGLANALLLGKLASRVAGHMGALAASVMWSFSPVAIASSFDGLETSLALTISLALVELWSRAKENEAWRNYIGAGILAGLALLARVDTAFLVGVLGLSEFIHGNKKGLVVTAMVAALVVSPWWIYSISHFSTIIPESGAAVKTQVQLHQSLYLNVSEQVAWTTGTIIGGPLLQTRSLQEYLFRHSRAGCFLAILFLLFVLVSISWISKKNKCQWPFLALTFHGILIAFFYTFYLPALWFFERYLHPTRAVVTLLLAILIAEIWQRRSKIRIAVPGLLIFALFLTYALFQSMRLIWVNPPTTPDVSLHGAKGYREVSQDVLKILPKNTVLGAFQSGALAFYAWPRFTVVNLDGVVDGKAARAIQDRQLGEYAQSRALTHFADWPFNYRAFRYFEGVKVERAEFHRIGEARPQGPDRTIISQIIWR